MTLNRSGVVAASIVFISLGFGSPVAADDGEEDRTRVEIIEPGGRGEVPTAAIDTERFEVGLYGGVLSVEDFGTEWLAGVEVGYHVTQDWLLQASYGQASIDEAAFENARRQFLDADDRDFEYLALSPAYRIFHGRSFFGAERKFNSHIYVLAGPERVSFADNDEWGLNFGLSYRVVLTDSLTVNVDFREHLFEREFIGDSKQTFNTELRIGINALF